MEVVSDTGVFELIDFVEKDPSSGSVVLLESVDEFIVGR